LRTRSGHLTKILV